VPRSKAFLVVVTIAMPHHVLESAIDRVIVRVVERSSILAEMSFILLDMAASGCPCL
jgi:hypothetical protein